MYGRRYFLSKQQVRLNKNRGTVDIVSIVRQIMEMANEHGHCISIVWTSRLHLYAIYRRTLWKMLRYVGVDPKMTPLIEAMYENVY